MKLRVGFAGMGIMGKPMALNIAKAGHDVAVYNRTRPTPESVPGLEIVESAEQLARTRDVLIVMVTG
ncbi:MAG: NAD(P)-binding domain-containing protein, partial [Acidobacteriota bacterium]